MNNSRVMAAIRYLALLCQRDEDELLKSEGSVLGNEIALRRSPKSSSEGSTIDFHVSPPVPVQDGEEVELWKKYRVT